MGLFLVICSAVVSFGVLIQALPPIEARNYIPSVGESCDFEGYSGVVTKTNDCPGAVSIWQYGPQAGVQCCIVASCNARGDATYGGFTCLNTYKKDECGQGQGRFVPGHCLADETVQCCVDGPLPPSASSGGDTTGYNNQNTIYDWHDPNDDGSVIVPTVPTVDKDSVIVPTYPAINNENENQDGGPIIVPTIETSPSFPVPPTRLPGENWHKKGWGDDIASALGFTSYDPVADEEIGYGDEGSGRGISSWGGYDDALHPFFLDA